MIAAAANAKTLWYVTRGTGVVALLLLTASVVLGTLSSARWRSGRTPRFVVGGLHRNLTLLAVAFVAVHVVTTVADAFAPIKLTDGVLPFLSPYRPLWLGLGTVAFDLVLALVVTSLVRVRLGYRNWRFVHWLAYAAWPVALIHAFGTGSDARLGWMAALGFGSCIAVAAAVLVRIARGSGTPGRQATAFAATIVLPLALFVWYLAGPSQSGWAKRSGTPAALLRRPGPKTQSIAAVSRTSLPQETFDASLTGRLKEDGPRADGLITIVVDAHVRGAVRGVLRITLWGLPSSEGGVSLTASDVAFGATGTTEPYVGRVVSLAGDHVGAELANASNGQLRLDIGLHLDRATGDVTGQVRGQAS
ncbi:MAG TPA: ferric reductase-like transmembrane domain-containing protein [Gaiellaceae bacterium]|nr:ferric reductase-like transmembrane domain-containing protein [Gaiellaceae bacterium]